MSDTTGLGEVLENENGGDDGVTLGHRIAGLLLVANALLVGYERIALSDSISFDGIMASPVSSIVDILLGIALLAGQRSVVGFVMFRCVIGGLLFGGLYISEGDTVMAVMQVTFSTALMLLLVGDAGKLRAGIATLACAGLFGLELIGIQMLHTGETPLGGMLAEQYDLGEKEVTSVSYESEAAPYRLVVPAGWARRSDESAKRDNPLSDVWFVKAENDAHITVIAEDAGGPIDFDLDAVVQAIEDNARGAATDFSVTDRGHVAAVHTLGTTLDTDATIQGLRMRFRYGVFVDGQHVIQVLCVASPAAFEQIEDDCDATLESFEFASERYRMATR